MLIRFFLLWATSLLPAHAQQLNSGQIAQGIKKLNVLGSALYIAAHPDDENTRLISYLANEKLVRTAYLSVTRGGGGQNLIGTEKGKLMAELRTQELLAARRIDGGIQFFTTATDFGYSKSPDETLEFWDKEKTLGDMVYVIRKFRPDVMITRFRSIHGRGHGHHSASAMLAAEAFEAAGDKNKFPEQFPELEPWQPSRLIYNTSTWRNPKLRELKASNDSILVVEVGGYNTLLGSSYAEISARSRSMHKSQGFGSRSSRGSRLEYFEAISDEHVPVEIFTGINTTWSRLGSYTAIEALVGDLGREFDPHRPEKSIDKLLKVHRLMDLLKDQRWADIKRKEIKGLVQDCLGLWLEAWSSAPTAAPGEQIQLTIELVLRRPAKVRLKQIKLKGIIDSAMEITLQNNTSEQVKFDIIIPVPKKFGQGYRVHMSLNIEGQLLTYEIPVNYVWTDRVKGEQSRPLQIVPEVTANFSKAVFLFPSATSKQVFIQLTAQADKRSGKVHIALPDGWSSQPEHINFTLQKKGDKFEAVFRIRPSSHSSEIGVVALVNVGDQMYEQSIYTLNYDHIPTQSILRPARARLIRTNLDITANKVAYIMGAGDEVPDGLQQLGLAVTMLTQDNINQTDLEQFDAIIAGIRAYNTQAWLKEHQSRLMEYVKAGGNYIVQYNTSRGLIIKDMGPYPFKLSRDRVTREDAPVSFIKHPLLHSPNLIVPTDFDGWVQERGLYFPNEWDSAYVALFSMNDPGETEKKGSLILADYGEGAFIYTGLSFFRQIPAGVPGAFRLLANLISYDSQLNKK